MGIRYRFAALIGAVLAAALPSAAATSNVTVTPGATLQTWHYWMGLLPSPEGGITPAEDPNWPNYKQQFLNQIVNQLGLNTIQLTENAVDVENTVACDAASACGAVPVNDDGDPDHFNCADPTLVDCPSTFPLAGYDFVLSQYLLGADGMKAMVENNGEQFHLVLQYIHWPQSSDYLDQNPPEVGEEIAAVFIHSWNKFGYVPDIVDMMVEPDLHADASVPAVDKSGNGVWDFVNLGKSAAYVEQRLNAAGFHPQIWCCSVTSSAHAVDWYLNAAQAAGANVLTGLTTHWYDTSNANWPAIDSTAAANKAGLVMTEYDAAGMNDLYNIVSQGNVSGFEKYGVALLGQTDIFGGYLMITNTSPYASHYINAAGYPPAWFMPQYMQYIREGDVRYQASSDNSCAGPLAFRSAAGYDKVAVRLTCTGNQTVNVTGVAPGTYNCTYTISNAVLLQPCWSGPMTITQGGTLSATIASIPSPPSGATSVAITFFAVAPTGGPVINQNGIGPLFSPGTTIQPGAWFSIFGSALAAQTATWQGNFPPSLGGVTVTVNNKPAYLWYVSPGQINAQAPDDTTAGPVNVTVTNQNGSATATVTLAPAAPSFSLFDDRHAAGVILVSDGSGAYGGGAYDLMGTSGAFDFATRPVKPGETVELFGVGFGPTTPTVQAGQPLQGVATTSGVSITVGGQPATVAFQGMTGAGLYQFNVVIPANTPAGDQSVAAMVNGVATPGGVFVTVK